MPAVGIKSNRVIWSREGIAICCSLNKWVKVQIIARISQLKALPSNCIALNYRGLTT